MRFVWAWLAVSILAGSAQVATAQSDLEQGFKQPPDSAKPRVWWHWMSGNVTQEGITADLEWMHRVNIGGMQMFDGNLGVPVFVDKPLVWMTPDWKAAWRHAAAEADRLNMEMAMAASGGWSETAGPWVKPEEGMKKYVWTETRVQGPAAFSAVLAHPPINNGRYQNMNRPPDFDLPTPTDLPGIKPAPPLPPKSPTPTFYADAVVFAYRVPDDEVKMAELHPKITSNLGVSDAAGLINGDFSKNITVSFPEGQESGWIQFEFDQPFTTRALTLASAPAAAFLGHGLPDGEVEASEGGTNWKPLVTLPGPAESSSVNFTVRTYSYPETTAKLYRIVLHLPKPNLMAARFGAKTEREVHLAQAEFFSSPRVHLWEDKASFGTFIETANSATPAAQSSEAISHADVVDLTSKMRVDGTLDWQVPQGKWVIVRLGYSLTGELNHPATPAATGLEVDKLSRKDVQSYIEQYAKMISDTAGPYFGKSFRYFLMDSWEAGQENWTEEMLTEFRNRRGYDMTSYLPVLTGRVVDSAAASNAFLWDFRRTIADMLADNHYRAATEYFGKFGVGLYAEAMGADLPTTGDGLLNKGQVSIPMGEFWTPLPGETDTREHPADVKEATSAAHIYGKPIAATESFTTMPFLIPWGQSPFYLKPLADQNFARGVNRIVFHTSDQQPFVDDAHKPGITLGFFGQHYTRNNTWAEEAVAWNTYLARCSYLLQQGNYVADVAYFYGEGAPSTVPFWKPIRPDVPTRYGYDFVNADVLRGASVQDGRITLKSGMSYRVLVLPDDVDELSLTLLKKIRDLVQAGAIVIGPKPVASPSLSDGTNSSTEVASIAESVWGNDSVSGHAFGKGKVYTGKAIEEVLEAEQTPPDFEYSSPTNVSADVPYPLPKGDSPADLVFIHRRLNDGDAYFIATQKPHSFYTTVSFRVTSREPELWYPDSGRIEPVAYSIANGRTTVPLHFDAEASVFVLFRKPAGAPSRMIITSQSNQLTAIQGPWRVSFPPNWGAPSSIQLDQLVSWTANADNGVKYFSGTATYSRDIDAPQEWFQSGKKIVLDLGTVKEIAELTVNGAAVGGILWKPPFAVDVTAVLKPGKNHIEVKVTNLWPNRMIGDLQPGATKTYSFTDFPAFTPSSPLLESGMLGPVRLLQTSNR